MKGIRGSTRRELGDLAVTALLAAGLLVASATAAAGGRSGPSDGTDTGAATVPQSTECRSGTDHCSAPSPAHVRLTMEPRTGVCLG